MATATSGNYGANDAGYYCFLAVYSGDTNYSSVSDGSTTSECFDVTQSFP